MSSDATTREQIKATNWHGAIPIHLTLAHTSISSPTLPPPIHVLVPRNTYLHVGLKSAVERLHPFAPCSPLSFSGGMFQISEPEPSGGSDSENETGATLLESASNRKPTFVYPVCWFEDEDSNMAVRWHFFAGVLFDLKSIKSLPWKLKLHFTNYPTSQLLPLAEGQVEVSLQNMYRHTLKQAMTLMSGNSKSAMNVTKESHGILWDAVQNSNYNLFRRVDIIPKTPVSYPVRVLVDTNPPIQKRVTNESLETLLSSWLSISYEEATVKVCGIEPPMHESIELLWSCFAYPDHFLYITVYTSSKDS